MTAAERSQFIDRYRKGYDLLVAALEEVPEAARKWKPAPDKWSVHEVVCHCADSETNSAMRIRYLVGEDRPEIQGYDQDRWATVFDYHSQSLATALDQIRIVRRWTLELIQTLPAEAWARSGTHSELPGTDYSAERWLSIYAEHLEVHARQIRRNLEAWKATNR